MKATRIGAGLAAAMTLGVSVLAPVGAAAQRGRDRDREERRDTNARRESDRRSGNPDLGNWQDRLGGIFGRRDRARSDDRRADDRSRRRDDRWRRDRDDEDDRRDDRRNGNRDWRDYDRDSRDRRDPRNGDWRDPRGGDWRDAFGGRNDRRDGWLDRESDRRQSTKNEWRNIAIGAGVVGVLGLLKKDNTLFFGGTAGALYSLWRYEQDRKSQSALDRARAEYFSLPYFTRDGRRYDRRTVRQNGQDYYRFECSD